MIAQGPTGPDAINHRNSEAVAYVPRALGPFRGPGPSASRRLAYVTAEAKPLQDYGTQELKGGKATVNLVEASLQLERKQSFSSEAADQKLC